MARGGRARAAAVTAAGTLGAALVLGGAAHLGYRVLPDSPLIALGLVIPIALGAGVGRVCAALIDRSRLASPRLAVAIAAGGAVVALVVVAALDRAEARARRLARVDRQLAYERDTLGFDPAGVDIERERVRGELDRELGGARGVLRFAAWRYGVAGWAAGEPVPEPARPLDQLGAIGALAYGVLELALSVGIATAWARARAARPACPVCGQWRLADDLGDIAQGTAPAVIERLAAGDPGAAESVREPDTNEWIRLTRYACPRGDDGGGVLRAVENYRDTRLVWRRRLVAQVDIAGDAGLAALAALAAPADGDHAAPADGDHG